MQKTDAELQIQLDEIKIETVEGANSKTRVAAMFENLKDSKIHNLIIANRQLASYTLVLTDAGKIVETNDPLANNVTVPPNSVVPFPIGTQLLVAQYGVGQTAIVGGAGVIIRSEGNNLKLSARYVAATLLKIATDEWYLFGNLTA